MRTRVTVLTAFLAVALVLTTPVWARPQTTAPPPVVTVKVTITDTKIGVSPRSAVRGAYARFILVNRGSRPHRFALGSTKPGTGRQTGFAKLLRPREQKVLFLFLDYRGNVAYRGTLPADRSKPGMRGVFTIS